VRGRASRKSNLSQADCAPSATVYRLSAENPLNLPRNRRMFFSVIVPTFNRPTSLQRCLAALSRLSYAKNEYEVIVVDDGGSADIGEAVAAAQSEMNVSLIRQVNCGPASARHNGAQYANGDFLAFTDDDCEPSAEWLDGLKAALQAKPDALAGGRVVNGLAGNPYAEASQSISEFCYSHFNRESNNGKFFESNNIALAKVLYRRVGFDETYPLNVSEDRDFCDRWLASGLKMMCAPKAIVVHRHQMGFVKFCRQHFSYGRGAWAYSVSRIRRNRGRVPFEGWRFHLGLVLSPFRRARFGRAVRLSNLIFLTQMIVVAGYVWERFVFQSPQRLIQHRPEERYTTTTQIDGRRLNTPT
jgi:GT2 family glycosyltransferase